MDSKDELPNDMQKYFQKGCNAMSTQQPSKNQRLAQKLQTQPGKEYSFSTKPGLREKKRQIQHRFANASTALKSLVSE